MLVFVCFVAGMIGSVSEVSYVWKRFRWLLEKELLHATDQVARRMKANRSAWFATRYGNICGD